MRQDEHPQSVDSTLWSLLCHMCKRNIVTAYSISANRCCLIKQIKEWLLCKWTHRLVTDLSLSLLLPVCRWRQKAVRAALKIASYEIQLGRVTRCNQAVVACRWMEKDGDITKDHFDDEKKITSQDLRCFRMPIRTSLGSLRIIIRMKVQPEKMSKSCLCASACSLFA